MISELDIHRAAHQVIRKYQETALCHAQSRMDRFTDRGDMKGASVWLAIIMEIDRIQKREHLELVVNRALYPKN